MPLAARVLLVLDESLRAPAADPVAQLHAHLAAVLAAVSPGQIAVQLRAKTLPARTFFHWAAQVRRITADHGALLLLNDRADIAWAVGADGLHLPGHGLPLARLRPHGSPPWIYSAAAHSLAEAQRLEQAGADCITLSPIWPTPSKPPLPAPDATAVPPSLPVSPLSVDVLAHVTAQLAIPVFALGGIDTTARVSACAAVGARVACLRAILQHPDPPACAAAFVAAATP